MDILIQKFCDKNKITYRQQGLTAIHFIPQLAAGDAALWGEFLCAVFHRWVREDIGR
ncbi:radical SAM protein, partial [Klebsiella pneumoniae]